jgi:hypothetical protein
MGSRPLQGSLDHLRSLFSVIKNAISSADAKDVGPAELAANACFTWVIANQA